jgi:hypothetical protein
MNANQEPVLDESDRALDRAIRAVLAEPAPTEVKNRVMERALGFSGGGPRVSHGDLLEKVMNMIQTHKRHSVAAAAMIAALAAGLVLTVSLVSPAGRAYALEETLQANKNVTSYHVKITPAAELGEAWVQLNPDGSPLQARLDLQSKDDGAKVVILWKGKSRVWFKDKKTLVTTPQADALARISEMRNLADPKLTVEQLQEGKAAGKLQIETKQPANESEPIVLTVTLKAHPDERRVYEVNSKAKLVERMRFYRRKGEGWEQLELRQYLDYNKPIDPSVFQPDIPKDVMVLDQIARKPGLVKGDLSEDEIATKVVREFFEALIAGDYDKAGLICEGVPGKKLEEGFREIKFLRVMEIGKPAPAADPRTEALRVPAKVEIEYKGQRKVEEFAPFVRPPHGQPARRVISGGI